MEESKCGLLERGGYEYGSRSDEEFNIPDSNAFWC